MQDSLLIELLTEELPPKSLLKLSQAFCNGIFSELKAQGFVAADADYAAMVSEFATPRRLGVLVKDVAHMQSERIIERKGPALASAYDQNEKPTPALIGFAKSCGVAIEKLEKQSDKKGEHFVFRATQPGEPLETRLATIVVGVIKKLPVAKLMRWGDSDVQFVRPVHGLIMLHGKKIVAGEVLGLQSGNRTLGHRFLSSGEIVIAKADDYERMLEAQGKVIASFEKRKQTIRAQIIKKEKEMDVCIVTHDKLSDSGGRYPSIEEAVDSMVEAVGGLLIASDSLSDEVTALVEYPVTCVGNFSEDFLDVPAECLILSMRQHQKYFPIFGKDAVLQSKFLFISNQKTDCLENIIHGNERVLHARLSDAKFFFEQDKKTRLEDRVPKLANVVYHHKLGSQLDRARRVKLLAGIIARLLDADTLLAERTAELAKADLLTDMVGEFPELQGIMGRYYALYDKEPAAVADAIEAHYRPRFAGDSLPESNIACAVALADKLSTLAGLFGVGQRPTGDKDPFGLRRAAVGVVRILIERKIDIALLPLVDAAIATMPDDAKSDWLPIQTFLLDRARSYFLEQEYSSQAMEAVLQPFGARSPLYMLSEIVPEASLFVATEEGKILVEANTRITNILKKSGFDVPFGFSPEDLKQKPNEALFKEKVESEFWDALQKIGGESLALKRQQRFAEALRMLSRLGNPTKAFFDNVMVNAEQPDIRDNRVTLLQHARAYMNQVVDLSLMVS